MNTKKIVHGAMIASLCGILSLINTYTSGFFDLFIYYFIAIYLAWYGYQYCLKDNILVLLVTIVIVFLTGIPTFLLQTIAYGCIGLFIGEALKKEKSKTFIIMGTFFICLLNNVMIYTIFSALFEVDLISEMTLLYQELKSLTEVSIPYQLFISLLPLVIAIMSLIETYLINLLCQLIFRKLKIKYPKNFHIATLHFPYYVGIIFLSLIIIGLLIFYFNNSENVIGQYCLLLGIIGFIIQGFALTNYYAIIRNLKYLIILSCFLFFIPLGIYIYVILGFLDIFTPIRKHLNKKI